MKRLLIVTVLLALLGSAADAEVYRFRYGEMVANAGDADSIVYADYDTADVAMVTICSGKPDSCIGDCDKTAMAQHHVLGFPSNSLDSEFGDGSDTCRVLCRFNVRQLPVDADVIRAQLCLYVRTNVITPDGVFIAVDPIVSDFTWCAMHHSGGRGQYFVPSTYDGGLAPDWFKRNVDAGTVWNTAGLDSAQDLNVAGNKVGNDRLLGVSQFRSGSIDAATGWQVVDVTPLFSGKQADSTNWTNPGVVISVDLGGGATAGEFMEIIDHLCTDATKRPYLEVEFVDTSHVETIPLRLGECHTWGDNEYRDTQARACTGRLVFFSDTHSSASGCGGVGDGWRPFRKLATCIAALDPPPSAAIHLGDLCLNPACTEGTVDSIRVIGTVFSDAGIEFYRVLGNWEAYASDSPLTFRYARHYLTELAFRRYYDVDFGFARLLCLNNNTAFNQGMWTGAKGCYEDSLTNDRSDEYHWLQSTLGKRRAGQPVVVAMHKNAHNVLVRTSAKGIRPNLRDIHEFADTLLAMTESLGAWLNVAGHADGLSSTPPLVHAAQEDTIYARSSSDGGASYSLAVDDSACVYYTIGQVYDTGYASDSLVAWGRARRWNNSADPFYLVVDFVGSEMRCVAYDTTGTRLDTLRVSRGGIS